MRPLLIAALFTSVAFPALAQGQISPSEGNWACKALADNSKAGLLSIFAGTYGYASSTYGSTASGTGNVQLASDGVTFVDGNLTAVGIKTGLITFDDQGHDILTLYSPDKPILSCTTR